MTYKVKLPVFEGPLDLLLYLIKKEELDIYDIPIAKITDQYLEYLELMKAIELNIAGEFLVMAATLIHIKSKMLLPQEEIKEDELIEDDPRTELVKRLLEYKKFKEAAGDLSDMEKRRKEMFTRSASPDNAESKAEEEDTGFEASIFDLITAFARIVKNISKEEFHKVLTDEHTVSQKIHDLFKILVEKPVICFTDLFKEAKTRLEAITIFLALLELIRLNEIVITQNEEFGEIKISRNTDTIKPSAEDTASSSVEN